MDLNRPPATVAIRCGARRRLRLMLGLRLLSAVEDRSHGAARGSHVTAGRLPSVRALAAAAGVHRNTAAAVYRDLERFGLVRCVRGAGTYPVKTPAHTWKRFREAVCADAELAEVLAAELRFPVTVSTARVSRGPLLLPLDESPPPDRIVIPVAPLDRALQALRDLRPDSTVRLVSASPRIGRLVRHTIVAFHGDAVGLARTPDGHAPAGASDADLALVDLWQLERRGTDVPSEGLTPLRLLVRAGREAG